jgi:hypothetical protein
MNLGEVFSEKLTQLTTAICCVDAASVAPSLVTPEMRRHALVEALLGGAALAYLLGRRRGDRFVSVLRRCTRRVDDSSRAMSSGPFLLPFAKSNGRAVAARST